MEIARELDADTLRGYAASGCFCAVDFDGVTRKGYLKYDTRNDVFYIANKGLDIKRVELYDGLLMNVQDRLFRQVCVGVTDLDFTHPLKREEKIGPPSVADT